MAKFAVINNGIIENILIAETIEDAELASGKSCIEATEENPAEIGWEFDGTRVIVPVVVKEDINA